MPSGAQEQGTWTATINAASPTGYQEQSEGAISYAIPLCSEYPENSGNYGKTAVVYRNALEAESPSFPCEGNVNNPEASPGYTCFYRGLAVGTLESETKNAKFYGFTDAAGNQYTPACTKEAAEHAECITEGGLLGELIEFRTTTFTAGTPKVLAASATLTAEGSWATRAR